MQEPLASGHFTLAAIYCLNRTDATESVTFSVLAGGYPVKRQFVIA